MIARSVPEGTEMKSLILAMTVLALVLLPLGWSASPAEAYVVEVTTSVALPFETRNRDNDVLVSNASGPGVQVGDVIKALGGERSVQPADFVRDRKPGDKVQVELLREGRTEQVEVALRERTKMTPALRFLEQPTDKQRRIRDGWLGGR